MQRKDSFEEFQRKQAAKRPPSSNTPDLPSLSLQEHTYAEAARGALHSLKKTFEHWVTIARFLRVLKDKADRIGGRFTFDRLREREGLGGRQDGYEVLSKARVSRLLAIQDNLPAVEAWRERLSSKQRFDFASPESVMRHCPVLAKNPKPDPEGDPPFKPVDMDRAVDSILHHFKSISDEDHKRAVIERIAGPQREDGDRFKPTDTADDIATVLVGMFKAGKAEAIARAVLAKLKARKEGVQS